VVILSFSGRRREGLDYVDLAIAFEDEFGVQTKKVQMRSGEIQYWFRYDGELEEKRWVFEEYGAEVVLRVGLPDLEEGKATKNEIAPLTPERFKAFISWLNERSRRTFSQR